MMHKDSIMTLRTLITLMLDSRTVEQMNLNRGTIMTLSRLMLDSV